MFFKDPENLGWVGCIWIDPPNERILLVRNLKQESQVNNALIERGNLNPSAQDRWRMKQELYRRGLLIPKPSKWELSGGKIPWWAGNVVLQKEFQTLNPCVDVVFRKKTRLRDVANKEQLQFLQRVGPRVLSDEGLLLAAADQTAEDEFTQETGLISSQKELVLRINGVDFRNQNEGETYPRFWYLVRSLKNSGQLRTEPDKDTISAPVWIPLMSLYEKYDRERRDDQFIIQRSHIPGIYRALNILIEEGHKYLESARDHLYKQFLVTIKNIERNEIKEESWEDFSQSVTPL